MKEKKTILVLFLSVVLGIWAIAGGLDPVAPPGSTMKTLQEVEPRTAVESLSGDASNMYVISQAGSYYLTGNISVTSSLNGIFIRSDNVILDMMGFRLNGPKVGVSSGIRINDDVSGTVIRNGTISNWNSMGINGETAGFTVIENVKVEGVTGEGIFIGGETRIRDCMVKSCASGFEFGTATVTRCTAVDNTGTGFGCGSGSVISECTSVGSGGNGFQTSSNVSIRGCTAEGSGQNGYDLGMNAQVSECVASDNGNYGFKVKKGSSVIKSTSRGNTGHGMYIENGSEIASCSVSENQDRGITAIDGCDISDCTAYKNGTDGIGVNSSCNITGCVVRENTVDGIRCYSNCVITDNNCQDNGNDDGDGANIHAFNNNSRIENNRCSGADRGLQIGGSGNIVSNNMVKDNTDNYDIEEGNQLNILLCQIPETIEWPAMVTLAGSLTGQDNEHGITVDSDDVTIDLGGHALQGGEQPGRGIVIEDGSNIEIRNGIIRGFHSGIYENTSYENSQKVTNVKIIDCKLYGIFIVSENSIIKDCQIEDIGESDTFGAMGIRMEQSATIIGNCVSGTDGSEDGHIYGIKAGQCSVVKDNTVQSTGYSGTVYVYGIHTDDTCTVSGNTVRYTGPSGMMGSSTGNNIYGIITGVGCTVTGNTVAETGRYLEESDVYGIFVGGGCLVDQNTAIYNNINMNNSSSSVYGINCAP